MSNYFLNRAWTFRSTGHAGREAAQFLGVSVLALLVGFGVSALTGAAAGLRAQDVVPRDALGHRGQLLRQQVLDVPVGRVTPARLFWIATAAFTAIGALLRLKGIHDPIFDHPGWRQGDTAAIARNFAQLQYNIFFPQTDYNGPPPNYVELELQIVPFLAATLYKLVGVHEVIGRLISLAFGIATIPAVAAFGRWLWKSDVAGFIAGAAFAVLPGAWYYSHTFMPDTAMVFFTTCALYACARWIVDEDAATWRGWWLPALLLMTAFLAKPVAVTAAIPIAACALARLGWRAALLRPQLWALFAVAFVPLALYDAYVSAHAEWHWASGITKLHVIPSLRRGAHLAGRVRREGRRVRVRVQAARDDDAGPGRVRARARGMRRAAALAQRRAGVGLARRRPAVRVRRRHRRARRLLPVPAAAAGRAARRPARRLRARTLGHRARAAHDAGRHRRLRVDRRADRRLPRDRAVLPLERRELRAREAARRRRSRPAR